MPPTEVDRRFWRSVDGSKAGLLRQKEVKTGARYEDRPVGPEGKAPNQSLDRHISPAYRADLPTGPEAMRDWLYQDTDHGAAGTDATAWTKIGDTLREQYVTPASQAAMFEAAATIPGTTLVRQADLAGRKGSAVSRPFGTTRYEYIFDTRTYDYLGERAVQVGDRPPVPNGAVVGWTAQVRVAIVDRAGQLP